MRTVVFGGSGFLGSYMVDELLDKGYHVLNIDLTTSNCMERGMCSRYDFMRFNVGSGSNYFLERHMKQLDPDIVFNFISTANIAACDKEPYECLVNNVLTNGFILQSIRGINCRYVYASSVYAGSKNAMFYGWSKKAVEEYIKRWYKQCSSNAFIILRYGTVYGPGATQENSLRAIVEHALQTKRISMYGTGDEWREYIHAADAAHNSLEIVNDPDMQGKTVKVTGNAAIKAKDVGAMIQEILGEEYTLEFRNETPKGHYKMTPYKFVEELPINYSCRQHLDFGLGVLQTIKYIKEA